MRAMSEEFHEPLAFFTSDFAKAFKQVPGVTELLHLAVVVQWDPTHSRPAFMIPIHSGVWGSFHTVKHCQVPSMVLLCHGGTSSPAD